MATLGELDRGALVVAGTHECLDPPGDHALLLAPTHAGVELFDRRVGGAGVHRSTPVLPRPPRPYKQPPAGLLPWIPFGTGSILVRVSDSNYVSGDDYVVEFLGFRFGFNALDFEQRVNAAAVRLGLVDDEELDPDEIGDLVAVAAEGQIDDPRSGLGEYLVRHWERLSLIGEESLVYWLRKLVFRGAWLDHRVKQELLEVEWDDERSEFTYRDPRGDRALLELAPVPSWHELQFRR